MGSTKSSQGNKINLMRITALKEKPGAYEIRHQGETIYAGIYINEKNRGVGFVGNAANNRYIFEFEDGMFSKSVKIFLNTKDNPLGKVDLGFTDSGTLKFSDKTYEWQAVGSSKVWLDVNKNVVMFLDLENNADKSPNVLVSANLDAKLTELLTLCGWYLLVIEWRAGLTNAKLAGMPVKTENFKAENQTGLSKADGLDWLDVIVGVATDF